MRLMDEVTDDVMTSSWIISSENVNFNFQGDEAKQASVQAVK